MRSGPRVPIGHIFTNLGVVEIIKELKEMTNQRIWSTALVCTFSLLIAGCGGDKKSGCSDGGEELVKLSGAGASFPAPIYTSGSSNSTTSTACAGRLPIGRQRSGINDVHGRDGGFWGQRCRHEARGDCGGRSKACSCCPMTAGRSCWPTTWKASSDLKLSREAYIGICLGQSHQVE